MSFNVVDVLTYSKYFYNHELMYNLSNITISAFDIISNL